MIASPHNRFSFSLIFHGAAIQKLVCTENIQKLPNKTINLPYNLKTVN